MNFVDKKMTNTVKITIFSLFWGLFYVIFGFESTVVALLLFILVKMGDIS